jgi:hypothetical protein
MPTVTLNRSWSEPGSTPISYELEKTADGEVILDAVVIPDESVDFNVVVAIDVSQLVALLIGSDQDLTIETNQPGGASGEPDDTLALEANAPLIWTDEDVEACPLSADVTILYITNGSGADATLNLRALVDPTP